MELGNAGGQALISDVGEDTFMEDVVEGSKEIPIIVDFWAPWCGPCKSLGPALEAEVQAAGGAVRMVKVNVDENQQLAAAMRVQSIPSVYAFHDGKAVDGFMGAQPPAQLKEFVSRVAALGGEEGGMDQALGMAEEMLENGEIDDAIQTFAAILAEDEGNLKAASGLMRAHLAAKQHEEAKGVLSLVPAEQHAAPELISAVAQLDLALQAESLGDAAPLLAAIDANPDDHQSRLDLATAMAASGDVEAAIDQLLESFRRDREWNDGAAKAQLFKLFETIGDADPRIMKGRRQLASLLF